MELLVNLLNKWVSLTGIDFNEKKTTFRFNDTWSVEDINKELKNSIELDDTGITSVLLFETFFPVYLSEKSYSMKEILVDGLQVEHTIAKARDIQTMLLDENVQTIKKDFHEWVSEALAHYHIMNEKTLEMTKDDFKLALLRRDAYQSMKRLTLHTLKKGKPTTEGLQYVKEVHAFWNLHSLIHVLEQDKTPSGISINLIQDPVEYSSYFVFAIKNGENIQILTDMPSYLHPLQKYMTRRPDRDFSKRSSQHYFPYDLMGFKWDEEGEVYKVNTQTTGIAKYQKKFVQLSTLNELESHSCLWIILMFSLIQEQLVNKPIKEELSYTGVSLISPTVETRDLVLQTPKLELLPLKKADVINGALDDIWNREPTGIHNWLEQRYGDTVSEEVFTLAGNELVSTYYHPQEKSVMLVEKSIPKKEGLLELRTTDVHFLGSEIAVHNQQKWVARYNQAVIIDYHTKKEYAERHDTIHKWYEEKVNGNKEQIMSYVAQGELLLPDFVREGFGERESQLENILKIVEYEPDWRTHGHINLFKKDVDGFLRDYRCFITGKPASIVAKFRLRTIEGLMKMTGCSKGEFPDIMQNWSNQETYVGNSILENLDPMEWVVNNPWKKMRLDVNVYLSKSGYNQLRKEAGLKPNKFWIKEK